MAKYPPENAVDGGFGRRDTSPAADRRLMENQDNSLPKGNTYAPDMTETPFQPEAGSNRAPQLDYGVGPVYRAGSLRNTPLLDPPYSVIESPEGCTTEVRELDIYAYGDGYDPKAAYRSRPADRTFDTDFDGSPN